MRRTAIILGVTLALAGAGRGGEPNGFFNGKDLTGWEGYNNLWSVKDGTLVGYTGEKGIKSNTFLISKKSYGDFELKFQVRLKGGSANSGVQIRSKVVDPKKFVVHGPQCDMGQQFWGSLYGEGIGGMMKASPAEMVKRVLKPDDFNDYYIKCVGKHVTIKLNGETTVDDDFPKMADEGIIAWQLHAGPSMEATFRNIQFRELKK
jgi:3-keto-disaccharide hydrolase